MGRRIVLLRGINLGPNKRVPMAELRELFSGAGFEDVRTYVQSGNVVFKSPKSAAQLVGAIERAISSAFGLDVTVLVRSKQELAKVVAGNPFAGRAAEVTHLHVTFLAAAPAAGRVRDLRAREFAPEELAVHGREVYLHCPNGYGRTKLNNAFLEKQLGVAGTTRNWRTVTTLADLAKA